ncbi:hypothetical protein SAMN06298216_3533 [Spirosomataceae bacterium TFI 002]|nr:hypothetical protein SAMN06298216_3533 [Spirosomataceae bacterium TFI 002]
MPKTSNEPNYEFSKIKDLYFPLNDYKYDHGPRSKSDTEVKKTPEELLGRATVKRKLKTLLDPKLSKSKNGAYLITGYRGMGKTSLLREVIVNLNAESDENSKVKSFEFFLSQDEVNDMDLLRQIAKKLCFYVSSSKVFQPNVLSNEGFERYKPYLLKVFKYFLFLIAFLSILILFAKPKGYEMAFYAPLGVTLDFYQKLFHNAFNESLGNFAFFLFTFAFCVAMIDRIWSDIQEYRESRTGRDNGLRSHKSRIRELSIDLNDRLYSDLIQNEERSSAPIQYSSESGPVKEILSFFSSKRRKEFNSDFNRTRNFSKVTTKEIEQILEEILEEIDQLRGKLGEKDNYIQIPEFIFVIDELDKVEPEYQFGTVGSESNPTSNLPLAVLSRARRRQQAIGKLLANFKSFLGNAKTKFVFIGGNGMFDAALADIADRESFYSSIFNEVINVPTFFKDSINSVSGISQLCEVYLSELLLKGFGEKREGKNEDRKYKLSQVIKYYFDNEEVTSESEKFKIVHSLQNYIIYLTYRSNGSPKKLIELIERNIINIERPSEYANRGLRSGYFINSSKVDMNKRSFFLRLSYSDQYEVNLNSNFYRPYLIVNSRHLKLLNDKLLYSTAFLLDHILKFHKTAFSWNNLELIPDIILSYKDPNFRKFYAQIMSFMQDKYLRNTINAVFQYKFQSAVSQELRYLSKHSQYSSAAFNFTLDESFHLKSYYKQKLAVKLNEYNTLYRPISQNEHVHSLGYLTTIIGDLHYYDEEFDDAIIYYTDAIQAMRNRKSFKGSSHQLVLYSSNKLKLGLCLEKTRSYDKAYSVYRSLIIEIANFSNDVNRTGKKRPAISGKKNKKQGAKESGWEPPYKRMQIYMRPHVALLGVIEKQRLDGITYYNLERNFKEYLNFLGVKFNGKKEANLFPDLIGKNEILNYNLISVDMEHSDESANNTDKKRVVTLIADYYLSVGSILYFKNELIFKLLFSATDEHKDRITNDVARLIKSNYESNPHYHPSHAAYLYYFHSLISFNSPFLENIKQFPKLHQKVSQVDSRYVLSDLKFVYNYLKPENYRILNSNQFEVLGNILGKLGNALATCLTRRQLERCFELENINVFKAFENEKLHDNELLNLEDIDDDRELSVAEVVYCYRLAYLMYREAGKLHSALNQYFKLLEFIRLVPCKNVSNLNRVSFDKIIEVAFIIQSNTTNVANRAQVTKYGDLFKWDEKFEKYIFTNLSNAPEIKELIILYERIQLKIDSTYQKRYSLGPYSTISSMRTRYLELLHQTNCELKSIVELTGCENHMEYLVNVGNISSHFANEMKVHVYNGIFCGHNIIRILNNFGFNYIYSFSLQAEAHRLMGYLSLYYKLIKENTDNYWFDFNSTQEELLSLTGDSILHNLDASYFFDKAKIFYQQVKQLHTEGSSYKEFSRSMYTLDDDLNDSLVHFSAAMERVLINAEFIDKEIKDLEMYLHDSPLYNIENYIDEI